MSAHEPACTGTKTCALCGRTLPALAFAAAKTNRDGIDHWCRDCHAEVGRHHRAEKSAKPHMNDPIVPQDTYD